MANVLWLPYLCAECGRMRTDAHGLEQYYDVLREGRQTWRCAPCAEAWRAVHALGGDDDA